MIKFQENKNKKRKLKFKAVWFAVLFLIIILIKPTWDIWRKYLISRTELGRAEQNLKELKERELYLNSELANLETELGQEREIINKFDLVHEGEELAVILEPEEDSLEDDKKDGFIKSFFKRYFGWIIK